MIRMFIDFKINGYSMGREIEVSNSLLELTILVAGTDILKNVEVWKYDQLGWRCSWSSDPSSWYLERTISDTVNERTIYYLRVQQVDGNMGWSSPIWVDR
jgi:hypothetical protein